MSKISEHYKWQFLKRNSDYQALYDFYMRLAKEEQEQEQEDDGLSGADYFLEDFFQEYKMQELLDYKNDNCPPGTFNKYRLTFVEIGPYSFNQVRDRIIFTNCANSKFEMNAMEENIIGKFNYLEKRDEKNLVTITLDISTPLFETELKQFFDKIIKYYENPGTKNQLKGYGDEKELEGLLCAYDLKDSGCTAVEIYRILKSKKLKSYKNETPENINSSIGRFVKRSIKFVKHAKDL